MPDPTNAVQSQLSKDRVDRFREAWQQGDPPDIAKVVADVAESDRRNLLLELVGIDLENRWRSKESSQAIDDSPIPSTPRLEDYIACYPDLGSAERLPLELIAKEYLVRHACGDSPDQNEYETRFPDKSSALKEMLSGVDAELSNKPPGATDDTTGLSMNPLASTIDRRASDDTDADRQRDLDREDETTPFGDYRLLEEIARGGMGVVYKAHQVSLNRTVALKMILAGNLATDQDVQRFHTEAESAAQLDHPGIVPIYQVGQHEGQHFFSMGFVDGMSLSERLRDGILSPREAAELMVAITDAVEYAHQQGVIHRDLKPSNILINKEGGSRVTDFGLAKQVASDSGMTATGQVMGTPSYMPPEQAAGRVQEVGTASDVYSLGAILYELLTGRPPFRAASAWETIKLVIEQDPVSPRQFNPTIDRDIETICAKCLQKKPSDRYASAAEFANDLKRFLNKEPIKARRIGPLGRTVRWCRRKPAVAALLVAVLLLAMVGSISAIVAQRASETRQLSNVTNRFEAGLDSPSLTSDYIDNMDLLIREIEKLAPVQSQESVGRLNDVIADAISKRLRRARLTKTDEDVIRAALDLLEPRSAAAARKLRDELESRLSRWQPVFELKSPFQNLTEVFHPSRIAHTNGRLVRTTRSPLKQRTLPTMEVIDELDQTERALVTCGRFFQIEAVFDTKWELASRVGLLATESDAAKGYSFLLLAPNTGTESDGQDRASTFAEVRQRRQSIFVEIRKDDLVIQRQEVRADQILSGPLTLRATREDSKLSLQINQLAALEFEDVFPRAGSKSAFFAVDWPDDVGVSELRALRKSAPRTPSPMQRGDELYDEQQFTEALDAYREQTGSEGDTSYLQEARYKIALCLLALNRNSDSEDLLKDLMAESGDRWPGLAGCQLWLLRIRQQRMDEADAIFDNVQANASFEQLAALLPSHLRQEIFDAYGNYYGGESDYLAFVYQYDRERLIKAERAATIDRLFSPDGQGTWRQQSLVEAYRFAGENDKAVRLAEQLGMEMTAARILRQTGKPEQAMERIRKLAASDPLPISTSHFLMQRCYAHAAVRDWDGVATDIDALFALPDRNVAISELLNAYLIKGMLLERRGFDALAMETWREGFQEYRQTSNVVSHRGRFGKVALIMGSLTGELTDKEALRLFSDFAGLGDKNSIIQLIQTLVAPQTIAATLRGMWQTDRGRRFAEDFAFDQPTKFDNTRIPLLLAGDDFFRRNAFVGDLSTAQETLVWNTTEALFDAAVLSGEIKALQLAQLGATWKGRTDFLGWSGVSSVLDPAIRSPLAYIFAHRFLARSQSKEARDLFRDALKDAPADSPLAMLAQADLDMLDAGTGRLVIQSDSSESSKLIVSQDGRKITTIEVDGTKHELEANLPVGKYQVRLEAPPEGLSVSPTEITLTPARRAKVKIKWLWMPVTSTGSEARLTGLIPHPARIPGIAQWQVETRHPRGQITSVSWSPNGELIACASYDSQVRVFAATTGELRYLFAGHTGAVMSVAWSPDSARLASTSTDATVRVWNLDGSPGLKFAGQAYGASHWRSSVTWSPDGKHLAATFALGVRIWNLDGALVAEQRNSPNIIVTRVVWSPTGNHLAADGGDGNIRILDTSGNVNRVLEGQAAQLNSLSWSHDGQFLASGGQDQIVRIWDISNDTSEPRKREQKGRVDAVSWSPVDHRLLISVRYHGIILHNVNDDTEQLFQALGAITWSHDGSQIATAENNRIQIWDVSGELKLTINEPNRTHAHAIAIHPKLDQFATGDDYGVRLWSMNGSVKKLLTGHQGQVMDLSWNGDGQWLASAGSGRTARLWKPDGTPGPVFKHDVPTKRLAWSPHDQLAVVGNDEKVHLWNLDGTMGRVLDADSKRINSLAYSRDGKLAVGSDMVVYLWDAKGQRLKPIGEFRQPIYSLDWSIDSRMLASVTQDWLRVKTVDGTELMSANAAQATMRCVAWSPDNKRLAAVGDLGGIKIWNLDGSLAHSLTGHGITINDVAWTPDTQRLLSIGRHATIRLWDTTTGEPIWLSILLPDGQAATFGAGGEPRAADPIAEEALVYLIESPPGSFVFMKPSEFHQRIMLRVPAD